jgi:hypothetical protein
VLRRMLGAIFGRFSTGFSTGSVDHGANPCEHSGSDGFDEP